MNNNNGYVTWKALIGIMISSTTLLGGAAGFHLANPHPSTITRDEFARALDFQEKRFDKLENKIDELIKRINDN